MKLGAWAVLVVALAPVVGAAACGGASSGAASAGDAGGPLGPDLAAACEATATVQCLEEATCRPADFRYPSVDACVAATKSLCRELSGVAAVFGLDVGGLDVDWNAFLDCAKKKAALGPSCRPPPTVTAADVLAVREACALSKIARPGTRAAGAPCFVELQCQPGLICSTETDGPDAGVCGTCKPLVEGASCTGQEQCGANLGFSCDAKTKTCVRNAHAGEACDARPCEPLEYLACDSTTKKCAPLARSGESCASIDCDTALFLFCSRVDQTCKPLPRNPGDACKPDGVCGAGLACDTTSFTCRALGGLGASCAAVPCDPSLGLGCTGSPPTCASAYAHPGDKCGWVGASNVQCFQSACDDSGTCVAYGLDGAACKSSTTCAEFYSCVNGACQSELGLIADAAVFEEASAAIAPCK
jgi:hypothetical protein